MSHIKIAVSEKAVNKLFIAAANNFHPVFSNTYNAGPFSAQINAGAKIVDGKIDLQNNGTIRLDEIDIEYDPLNLTLGIDIPTIRIGGWCILPTPWGCAVRLPVITFFAGNPDISIPINLDGLIRSEISGGFEPIISYNIDPGRLPAWNYLDAEDHDKPNKWKLFINAVWLDFDLIDIADTVGNILDHAIQNILNGLFGWLPGWARSIIEAILGGFVWFIRQLLDIGDDIIEWLSNLLQTSLGLFNWIATEVANYFASQYPLYELEDPYPILPYSLQNGVNLIPVKIPIEKLQVNINDEEMVLSADINAIIA